MAEVIWMWFGNRPQINATPNTPATLAEANSVAGYSVFGSDNLTPVTLDGTTMGGNFRTTYQSPVSNFTYTSTDTGAAAATRITGFLNTEYRITLADGTTADQRGVLIQMNNGDMFFRPARITLSNWDGITSLRGMTIR